MFPMSASGFLVRVPMLRWRSQANLKSLFAACRRDGQFSLQGVVGGALIRVPYTQRSGARRRAAEHGHAVGSCLRRERRIDDINERRHGIVDIAANGDDADIAKLDAAIFITPKEAQFERTRF